MKHFMIAALLAVFPSISHAASFDCAKATTHVEKFVCANEDLSKLDDKLAEVYKDRLASVINKAGLRGMQNDWRIIMTNKCKDVACVKQDYETQIADLQAFSEESYSANYKSMTVKSLTLSNLNRSGFDARFVEGNVDDGSVVYCSYPQDGAGPMSFTYAKPDQAVWEKDGCKVTLDLYGGAKDKVANITVITQNCESLCNHEPFDDYYIPDYEPVAGNQ